MAKEKKKIDSSYLIPGCLLFGIGLGFITMKPIPVTIPGFTLVGLGTGFILAYVFRQK